MRSRRTVRIAGYSSVLLGIFLNKWILAPFATDNEVSAWTGLLLLFQIQIPLILVGVIAIARSAGRPAPRWLDLALMPASLAFVLASTEVVLNRFTSSQLFQPAPRAYVGEFENRRSKHFIEDPATGWRMRPETEFQWLIDTHWNRYRSNRQGFRSDVDFERIESPGRIVVVGDSFAFGVGVEVEATFASLVEDTLASDSTVFNLAMPGFGLDQMWMSVRHQGLPMDPDLVIVAFIDDDLDRSLTAYRKREGFNKPTFELEGAVLRPQRAEDRPHSVSRFLEHNSALWAAVRASVRAVGFSVPIGDWWWLNEAIFKSILDECRTSGVSVLLVRLPSKNWREFPNLQRLVESHGADLLDLGSPDMRPNHALHFDNDGHINSAGHAFVADRLIAWITERLPTAVSGRGSGEIR